MQIYLIYLKMNLKSRPDNTGKTGLLSIMIEKKKRKDSFIINKDSYPKDHILFKKDNYFSLKH